MQATKARSDEATKGIANSPAAPPSLRRSVAPSLSRPGFSFAELMFAVLILGIGFIMVAALFPVSIKQTKMSTDETIVGALARSAISSIEPVAIDEYMPATGSTAAPKGTAFPMFSTAPMPNFPVTGRPTCWQSIRGNMILPDDPRYAWVALYKRDGDFADRSTWSSFAQIIVIGVQISGQRDTFTNADVQPAPATNWPNLYPRELKATITDGVSGNADTVTIAATSAAGVPDFRAAVSEGSYIVIARDNVSGASAGRINGHVYRVGINIGGDVWELIPGNDFDPDAGADGILGGAGAADDINGITDADAWVIGKSFYDPNNNGAGAPAFDGNAMDITAYTTFVKVKPAVVP